jgi:hypothetical protein
MAKKITYNEKLSEQKKAFRIPVPKKTTWFKDKSKYTRKKKYKDDYISR